MRKIFGIYILKEKELDEKLDDVYDYLSKEISKIEKKSTWSAIRPVINDLEKLRKNTWDQMKITQIQQWLRSNFEVESDEYIED